MSYFTKSTPPRRIYFQPNPGNAGDSLITYVIFPVIQKVVQQTSDRFDPQGKIVIYGVGAISTRYYDFARKQIRHYQERATHYFTPT